jgi:DNA-binding CsgD family transcriptional regulator
MTDLDPLKLQLCAPGTFLGFRRRVAESLRTHFGSEVALFAASRDATRILSDGVSVRHDAKGLRASLFAQRMPIETALGLDVRGVLESNRRVYLGEELYPEEALPQLPLIASEGLEGLRLMVTLLHEGNVLFGLLVMARKEPFSAEQSQELELLTPFLISGIKAQIAYEELSRESVALRMLSGTKGTLCVVDRDNKQVVWAANRDQGITWSDLWAQETAIATSAETLIAALAKNEAIPTLPKLALGTMQAAAKFDSQPAFGHGRYAVVRLEPNAALAAGPIDELSKREREIAKLLVAGYTGVNIAAIAGLSENTVRTYVRRLYSKLGVSSRADLVRKLVTPEPTRAPASQLAPPPDSSLVYGDDLLD